MKVSTLVARSQNHNRAKTINLAKGDPKLIALHHRACHASLSVSSSYPSRRSMCGVSVGCSGLLRRWRQKSHNGSCDRPASALVLLRPVPF